MENKYRPVLAFSFLMSFSFASLASESYFYMLGGGGEPSGRSTMFDTDLKTTADFMSQSKWKTTVSFNGGHSKTEEIIGGFKGAKNQGAFTEENYNALLNEMIGNIQQGKIKKGDQLMVHINTHGARQKAGEKTHKVALAYGAATELSNLSGAKLVNLDTLEKLIEVASAKGVKLAIADLSCFSGNLQNLKSDKVCLITAAGKESYGYSGGGTFTRNFVGGMRKGANLEDVFLNARVNSTSTDFPTISTNAGKKTDEMLRGYLEPYLDYNNRSIVDLRAKYKSATGSLNSFDQYVCSIDESHQDFFNVLDLQKQVLVTRNEIMANDFLTLKDSLQAYRQYSLKYEQTLREYVMLTEQAKAIAERDYSKDNFLWRSKKFPTFLMTNYDESLKRYKAQLAPTLSETNKVVIEQLERSKLIAEDVKKKLDKKTFNRIKKLDKELDKFSKSYNLANNVAKEAKKIYDKYYKANQEKESNPCRDFVL